jgi:hypothetical protein
MDPKTPTYWLKKPLNMLTPAILVPAMRLFLHRRGNRSREIWRRRHQYLLFQPSLGPEILIVLHPQLRQALKLLTPDTFITIPRRLMRTMLAITYSMSVTAFRAIWRFSWDGDLSLWVSDGENVALCSRHCKTPRR